MTVTKNEPNQYRGQDSFPGITPFPNYIQTAPLLRISLQQLLNGDSEEQERLWKACCELGFFYLDLRTASQGEISGNGILKDADDLFRLQEKFYDIPLEEKQKFDFKDKGSYFGYKGYGSGIIDKQGTKDRNEFYNISKDDILSISERIPAPTMLDEHRPLLSSFIRRSHSIVTFILGLLNSRLALPDGTLQSMHRITAISGDQVRFIKAPPQPIDDSRVALGEHTDFGSVTILFNRIGGLQVRLPRGGEPINGEGDTNGHPDAPDKEKWAYVRPLPGHAIINLGDALVKFSAGVLRSNIHRVVAPPGEQSKLTRYSLVYFARPEDDVMLKALRQSPVIENALKAKGQVAEPEEEVTSKEWILRRALGRRGGGDWEKSSGTERSRA